jgi:organic radical activating enzyme
MKRSRLSPHRKLLAVIDRIRAVGTLVAEFFGGEPLVCDDIRELAEFCRKNGIKTAVVHQQDSHHRRSCAKDQVQRGRMMRDLAGWGDSSHP